MPTGLRIAVIGCRGVVGNATARLLVSLGHKVTGCDKGDSPTDCDIAFVCIPEREVIADTLKLYQTGLFVIRSTVPPGTCEALQDKLGVHVAHNPEFLRESSAVVDVFNPDRIIIGECCPEHGTVLRNLFEPLRRPIHTADRRTTELTKLTCNAWLATVISYWNEVDLIAGKLGVNGAVVGMLASTDPRISCYGSRFHNRFGGKCLPKDTEQLVKVATQNGVHPMLLRAVLAVNEAK